jgi:hypothetical protein
VEASPQVAGLQSSIKLASIAHLLDNKDKNPQAIKLFTDQTGLAQKYPLGFSIFYSDGRKILYYGKTSGGGISFDPSLLTVTRVGNRYCMNVLPVKIKGNLLGTIRDICVENFAHLAQVGDVILDIELLAGSDEGAAWVLGMKPAP